MFPSDISKWLFPSGKLQDHFMQFIFVQNYLTLKGSNGDNRVNLYDFQSIQGRDFEKISNKNFQEKFRNSEFQKFNIRTGSNQFGQV